MKSKTKWTFMAYMAGNNDLSNAGESDLEEMQKVGSSSDINIVVQLGKAGNQGAKRYYMNKNGSKDVMQDLGLIDMGDPGNLIDFIDWSAKKYPAEHYALILWGHGGGWMPTEINRITQSANPKCLITPDVSTMIGPQIYRSFFTTPTQGTMSQEDSTWALCLDDRGHSIDTVELGNALSMIKELLGKPLDLLGMDACLMSNLEVAYQAAPYVRFMVSSEESEPNEGWPYDTILHNLVSHPDISAAEFAANIVRSYTDYYQSIKRTGVTLSALDLSKATHSAKAVDELGKALTNHMPNASAEIRNAQRNSSWLLLNNLWDILSFSCAIKSITKDDEVRVAANNVINAFAIESTNFITAESHIGSKYDSCCGVTIYLISPYTEVSQYYGDLAFSKDHINWPQMLREYVRSFERQRPAGNASDYDSSH